MISAGRRHLIKIGEGLVIEPPDRMETVLGSCLGVVLYDRMTGRFGLAHVLLPEGSDELSQPTRFASSAPAWLAKQMKVKDPRKVRAVLAGGGRMFEGRLDVGHNNEMRVRQELRHLGIRVLKKALGGTIGRKITVDAAEGVVTVYLLEEGQAREEHVWKLRH